MLSQFVYLKLKEPEREFDFFRPQFLDHSVIELGYKHMSEAHVIFHEDRPIDVNKINSFLIPLSIG